MQHKYPGNFLTVILLTLLTFIPRPVFAQAPPTIYLPLTVSSSSSTHNRVKPTIKSFAATPESITAGGSSTLSWNVTGADSVSISPAVGGVTGTSVVVNPQTTTEYTLAATNAAGSATAKTSVMVTTDSPPGTKPIITSFAANPATIAAGGNSTLSWNVTGADSLSISPAVGGVTGTSVVVNPQTTTEYTLMATNAAGSTTAKTSVMVTTDSPPGAKPIITGFAANPATIAADGSSTLSWNVTGADSLSISPGVGGVTGNSVAVNPQTTTEYTLMATNAAGSTSAKTTVTVTEEPVSDDGAAWLPFTTIPDGVLHTRGANLALDSQGGIHAAYAVRTGLDNGQRPAYYAFCSSDCNDAGQWTRVGLDLGEWVGDVRIAVDSAGHPRMLIFSTPSDDNSANHFTYATCDSQCTQTASWTLTPVGNASLADPTRWDYVFRYFALDPLGHPAFLYTDSSQGINHNGTFYKACMTAPDTCTDAGSWTEVQVDPHWLGTPSLAFSPQGQPRVAVYYWDDGDELVSKLLYLACDADCFDPGNWPGIFLTELHGSSRYSLRVDSLGRPRMAFFSGSKPDANFQPNRLYYIWCNTNCTTAGENDWAIHDLGLSNYYGQDTDLVLDAAGRPRIVYDSFGSGLGYAWCDANCESDTAVWQHQLMEPSSKLETDYPVAPILRCSISTWVTGQEPMLALDSAGNARVGYFAEHGYGGKNLDEPWKTCPSYADIILARFMQFSQP